MDDLETYYRFVTDQRPGLPADKPAALTTLFARDSADLPPEGDMTGDQKATFLQYQDNVERAIQGALLVAPRFGKNGRVRSYYAMFKVPDPNLSTPQCERAFWLRPIHTSVNHFFLASDFHMLN